MNTRTKKIRRKIIMLISGLVCLVVATIFVPFIRHGNITAHAHSGNTNANGGHTATCRNSGYKNHTSACTYHYHNSAGQTNTGIGSDIGQSYVYEIPKMSDGQIQEYLKNATKQLERENAIHTERNTTIKNSTSENTNEDNSGIIALIVFLFGICIAIVIIRKKKRKA